MRKKKIEARRDTLATPDGIIWWEQQCGFTSVRAAKELYVPLRTYMRWKAQGLPEGSHGAMLAKESTLDAMEALLKTHG